MQQKGSIIFMSVPGWLKEERERLGLSQTRLGELVGAGKTTVINWEKGASAPDAIQLAAMAAVGADVLYILTGQRVGSVAPTPALKPDESALLDNYRHSPKDQQAILQATGAAFAQPKGVRKKAG